LIVLEPGLAAGMRLKSTCAIDAEAREGVPGWRVGRFCGTMNRISLTVLAPF
jgi:hypothetical protein